AKSLRQRVEMSERLDESSLAKQIPGERRDERKRRVLHARERLAKTSLRLLRASQFLERKSETRTKLRVRRRSNQRCAEMISRRYEFAVLACQIAEHVVRFRIIGAQREQFLPRIYGTIDADLARQRRVQTHGFDVARSRIGIRFCDTQRLGCIAFRQRLSRESGGTVHCVRSQSASDAWTFVTTLFQSPRWTCLNKRTVGYHTDSVPDIPHRQSGAKGSRTHVGRASAPPKWAMLVSTQITRSIAAISAAVPSISLRASRHARRLAFATVAISSSPAPFCSENQAMP